MSQSQERVLVAEQVFEARHVPVGSFLDVRGFVADYVRDAGFLPHWKIDTNVVSFRDTQDRVEKEGAFAGYRSVGYVAKNPPTRNFFADRAAALWKIITKNEHYVVPQLTRFGARTRAFLPSTSTFESVNGAVFQRLYSTEFAKAVGGDETDVQFIVELTDGQFQCRVSGGPMRPGEARKQLDFDAKEFDSAGLFLDVDVYCTQGLDHSKVAALLKAASTAAWEKIEQVAATVGV